MPHSFRVHTQIASSYSSSVSLRGLMQCPSLKGPSFCLNWGDDHMLNSLPSCLGDVGLGWAQGSFLFFSKTKRFWVCPCSRSYSSNSKKASILARLQVRGSHLEDPSGALVVLLGPLVAGAGQEPLPVLVRAQRAWAVDVAVAFLEAVNSLAFLTHPFLELKVSCRFLELPFTPNPHPSGSEASSGSSLGCAVWHGGISAQG